MFTRICCLLSLSRTVTEVAESTVMAKGTPSSSVLAYRLPIDVPIVKPSKMLNALNEKNNLVYIWNALFMNRKKKKDIYTCYINFI